MKVLHINQSDVSGGAALAAWRLHTELRAQGVDSKMLVSRSQSGAPEVDLLPRRRVLARLLGPLTEACGLNYVHFAGAFDIAKHAWFREADVVNVHNMHGGAFNYLALARLASRRPCVLTLHDMWSFTGHCAYSFGCARWEGGCGSCPLPDTYPAIRRDNTRLEWRLKDWTYSRCALDVVAPSQWLAAAARQSMLGRFPVRHIPYGIDTEAYRPYERQACRAALGIGDDRLVVMAAAEDWSDPRKGGDLLVGALDRLPAQLRERVHLLLLGHGAIGDTRVSQSRLGFLALDQDKAAAYSAADCFVLPTRADNLPLVLLEAMACGTPLVSFDVGGVGDLVRDGVTGRLAAAGDVQGLADALTAILAGSDRATLSAVCRRTAIEEFGASRQAEAYRTLYESLSTRAALPRLQASASA